MKKTMKNALITAIVLCIAGVTRSTGNGNCANRFTPAHSCYKKITKAQPSALPQKETEADFIFTNRLLFL